MSGYSETRLLLGSGEKTNRPTWVAEGGGREKRREEKGCMAKTRKEDGIELGCNRDEH